MAVGMVVLSALPPELSQPPATADPVNPAVHDLLWQTNSAGDDIHLFRIDSGELVRRLRVGDHPHGIARAPGSNTVLVSLERNDAPTGVLLWIDKNTLEIEHRLEIGPEPHAIAVTPDGKWAYIPCRDESYWVVDVEKHVVVDRIKTGGRPHNTTVSSKDGLVYLSPMGEPKRVTVVDPKAGHRVVGVIEFSASVRPPAIASSRELFFQHVDGLNGFEVAGLISRKRFARVEHSHSLSMRIWPPMLGFLGADGFSRCHGLAVRPGDEEIWSICGANATVHALTSAGFPERRHIRLPAKGYWLTFSSDGQYVFVALANDSEVAMINADTGELVRILPAGAHPKRNLVVPAEMSASHTQPVERMPIRRDHAES